MHQHIALILYLLVDGFDALVEDAFDVLGLGVFRKEGHIGHFAAEFVHAVVRRDVDY
jgi:hypothetical protein